MRAAIASIISAVLLSAPQLAAAEERQTCGGDAPCSCPSARAEPSGEVGGKLEATFLGVSTILLDDGRDQLLIDGFISRPGLLRSILLPIGPDEEEVREVMRRLGVTNLRAVLVAHAHHDHALDAPFIAREKGAVLVGSPSVANLGLGAKLDKSQICDLQERTSLVFGDFQVTAIPVPHGPQWSFERRLLDGVIDEPRPQPAFVWQYKGDQNYAFLIEHRGRRILVHPSAGHVPGAYSELEPVGAVFLGVGRIGKESETFTNAYWCEVVGRTGPSVVVPVHWDSFVEPLAAPLPESPRWIDDLRATWERLERLQTATTRVRKLDAFQAIDLRDVAPGAAKSDCPAAP